MKSRSDGQLLGDLQAGVFFSLKWKEIDLVLSRSGCKVEIFKNSVCFQNVGDCEPYAYLNTSSDLKIIAPCGAVANSMFNG